MINELGDNLIPLSAIGCTFVFLIVWVVAATLDSLYKTRCEARLKDRLIEMGASAAEIDRIIRAGKDGEEATGEWETAAPRVPPVAKQPPAGHRMPQSA